MTERIQNLLPQLDDQLSNRSFEDARETAEELRNTYEDLRESEQDRLNRARSVSLEGTNSLQEASTLSGLSQIDGSTRFERVALLTMVRAVTETHEELESQGELEHQLATIRAAIEDLQTGETQLTEQATEADSTLQNTTVPTTIAIPESSFTMIKAPPEGEAMMTFVIKNVGDETANDIQISGVGTQSALNVGTDSVAELSAGDAAEATLKISNAEAGTYTLEAEAVPDDGQPGIITKTIRFEPSSETDTTTQDNNGTADGDDLPVRLIGGGVVGGVSVAVLMKWLLGDD